LLSARQAALQRHRSGATLGANPVLKESMMESLICRMLMVGGLVAGVLLAGGQWEQAFGPVILALLAALLIRRIWPLLPLLR
jgi:hypothetical protein